MASGGSSESLVPRREEETLNEDEGETRLARRSQSPPVLSSTPGARAEQSAPESPPPAFGSRGNIPHVGSGPRAFFHRRVAVRMLRDYLQDLVLLNNRQLEGVTQSVRQHLVQKRIEEYQGALDEMVEGNEQEPHGQLTWKERDIMKRMLEDYSRGLEEFLDNPDDLGADDLGELDNLKVQLAMVQLAQGTWASSPGSESARSV